jgi:hypothetical protein
MPSLVETGFSFSSYKRTNKYTQTEELLERSVKWTQTEKELLGLSFQNTTFLSIDFLTG